MQRKEKKDLGAVSATEVAAVPCSVHADAASHAESMRKRLLAAAFYSGKPDDPLPQWLDAYVRAELSSVVDVLKAACDRDWKHETPIQVANIVVNAIYWRDREIQRLNDVMASAQRDVQDTLATLIAIRDSR